MGKFSPWNLIFRHCEFYLLLRMPYNWSWIVNCSCCIEMGVNPCGSANAHEVGFFIVEFWLYLIFLLNTGGRKPVPLQRVMILEVSQYLENYLLPNFSPDTASFEHVMSMILMVNEKVLWYLCTWLLIFLFSDSLHLISRSICMMETKSGCNIFHLFLSEVIETIATRKIGGGSAS